MPTENQLREGAKLVRYEYRMLATAAQLWVDHGLREYSREQQWERRIVTDVFLLHARNLLDFLVPRDRPRQEDVLARHYNPTWECSAGDRLAGRTILDWRRRIDKLLSHVTYERTTLINEDDMQPRWPVEEIHEGLVRRLSEFVQTLPHSRRDEFGPEIQAAPTGSCR